MIGFIPRSGFNLDTSLPRHIPSMYSLVESGCFSIVELITSPLPFIDTDIFVDVVARD